MVTRSLWIKLAVLSAMHGTLAAASQCGQAAHSDVPDILWQFDAGGTISTKPVLSGELVFVASDSGKVYALKRETGKEVWTFDSHADGVTAFRGGPLLFKDTVIVGATKQTCAPNQTGYVYGLEQRTGHLRWKIAVPGVRTKFLQIENAAIFGTGRDEWISIELRTGKLDWKFTAPDSAHQCNENGSPATDGVNIVVVAHNLKLYGLDATGRKVWDKALDAAVSTNPFVFKDVAYFGSTDKHVRGVNPATGEVLVDLPVPVIPVRTFTWGGGDEDESEYSFGLAESSAGQRSTLLAYADEFERVMWSIASDHELKCEAPHYWRHSVLTGSCRGQIVAYAAKDGRQKWIVTVKGCVRIFGGDSSTLFVGVEEGTLYSLGYQPTHSTR